MLVLVLGRGVVKVCVNEQEECAIAGLNNEVCRFHT